MKRVIVTVAALCVVGALVMLVRLRPSADANTPVAGSAEIKAPESVPQPAPLDVHAHEPDAALPSASEKQQGVIVHLHLSDGKSGTPAEVARLQDLELRLQAAIDRSGAGELDGNDIGDGEYVVFAYGPDADKLFHVVEPALRAAKLEKGSFVIKRYGPDDDESARETQIDL